MNRDDIRNGLDYIFGRLSKIHIKDGMILDIDLEKVLRDDIQRQTAVELLIKYGAVKKTKIGIEKTDKFTSILEAGGSEYILRKEEENRKVESLKNKDLKISIKDKKTKIITSIIGLLITIATLKTCSNNKNNEEVSVKNCVSVEESQSLQNRQNDTDSINDENR